MYDGFRKLTGCFVVQGLRFVALAVWPQTSNDHTPAEFAGADPGTFVIVVQLEGARSSCAPFQQPCDLIFHWSAGHGLSGFDMKNMTRHQLPPLDFSWGIYCETMSCMYSILSLFHHLAHTHVYIQICSAYLHAVTIVQVCWSGSDVAPSTGGHDPEEGDGLWRPRWVVAGLFTALISLLLPCNMTSPVVPCDWVPFCDLSSEVTLFIIEGFLALHWLHDIRSPWHILVLCDCLQSSHLSPILLADKYPEWGYGLQGHWADTVMSGEEISSHRVCFNPPSDRGLFH